MPRSDIDTKQITQNKAICLPRSARFGFDIGGFKKDFLVNVPSASAAISNIVTKSAKWRVSVKAMAAGLVVFANKA